MEKKLFVGQQTIKKFLSDIATSIQNEYYHYRQYQHLNHTMMYQSNDNYNNNNNSTGTTNNHKSQYPLNCIHFKSCQKYSEIVQYIYMYMTLNIIL